MSSVDDAHTHSLTHTHTVCEEEEAAEEEEEEEEEGGDSHTNMGKKKNR